MSRSRFRLLGLALGLSALLVAVLPRPAGAAPVARSAGHASATLRTQGVCTLTGLVRTDGSRCPATGRVRRQILGIGSPLHYLNPVHAITKVAGGITTSAFKAVALAILVGWVASSAESALKDTAKVISASTRPQLTSSWFSASYWRMAAIAALLTLPFLCAAAVHALVRSDLGLLTRAAFGYLPLSLLAVGIASQLTMLLISGTDEMSSIISSASGNADGVFLARTGVEALTVSVGDGGPFIAFLTAIITVLATLTLWVELLVRDAAVDVIVLMLPLFFAAMVWPARRTLAIRAIETLIALILSKFAIVAVLSLGGAALGHTLIPGPAAMLTGATLVLLAAFSPWALLRVLPLHEVASAAAGGLSSGLRQGAMSAATMPVGFAERAAAVSAEGVEWLRPRLMSQTHSSPLDGSRYRDAHRAASLPDSDAAAGPPEPADADREPVTAGLVDGALGGGQPDAAGGDSAGEWPWPQRPAAAPHPGGDVAGARASGGGDSSRSVAGRPGAGEPASDGVDPDADDAGGAAARRGPDGTRPPFLFGPDDPPLVLGEERPALPDRATEGAAPGRPPGPTPDPPPGPPVLEPPPVAEHDPVGGPVPPPGPGPIAAPPRADDLESPPSGEDGHAG